MLPPFFHQTPFFRLLLPFIAGIAVAFYFKIPAEYCISVCAASLTATVLLLWKWKRNRGWLYGIFTNVFLFAAGVCAVSLRTFVPVEEVERGTWLIVIDEPPFERANSMKANARIRANITGEQEVACDEHIVAYFRKDSLSRLIRQGDLLIVNATLNPVTNAGNPNEFDYRGYLSRKNIGRSAFAESGQWQKLDSYAQTPLFNFSNRIRYHLLDVLKRSGVSGNELSVVSALTLGYRADIDDELRKAYSTSGAIHVLAVSGLHVGIVFMVLNTFLMLFPFLNRVKWLKMLIQLATLWLFAIITGLSPSVTRAATMFSFMAAGMAFNRQTYIYNSIAASAFILLLVNPNNLLDAGFQFSYSAVIAIVFLHPFLYQLLTFKNMLPDMAWDLTCVSISAQLGVAPLALCYFHQFPTYFILSNFIVIPAASVIVYGAFLLFAVSPVPFLLETVGWLLDKFMYGVNFMIFFIEKLPGSVTLEIRFAYWEIPLAYTLIALFGIWMLTKRKTVIFAILFVILFWMVGTTVRTGDDLQRQQLIVYNTHGNSLLQFVNGRENTVWHATNNNTLNLDAFLYEQRTALQLDGSRYHHLDSALFTGNASAGLFTAGNFVQFAGKRLAIFTRDMPPQNAGEQSIQTDVAILTQNANARISQIIETYNPDIFVIDASNSKSRIDRWETECAEAGVKCHRVDRDGAFVLGN